MKLKYLINLFIIFINTFTYASYIAQSRTSWSKSVVSLALTLSSNLCKFPMEIWENIIDQAAGNVKSELNGYKGIKKITSYGVSNVSRSYLTVIVKVVIDGSSDSSADRVANLFRQLTGLGILWGEPVNGSQGKITIINHDELKRSGKFFSQYKNGTRFILNDQQFNDLLIIENIMNGLNKVEYKLSNNTLRGSAPFFNCKINKLLWTCHNNYGLDNTIMETSCDP